MFPVMVRFLGNGVDHLGIGSKLLTQQEEDTFSGWRDVASPHRARHR